MTSPSSFTLEGQPWQYLGSAEWGRGVGHRDNSAEGSGNLSLQLAVTIQAVPSFPKPLDGIPSSLVTSPGRTQVVMCWVCSPITACAVTHVGVVSDAWHSGC